MFPRVLLWKQQLLQDVLPRPQHSAQSGGHPAFWAMTVDSLIQSLPQGAGCPRIVGMGLTPPKLALVMAVILWLCGNGLLSTMEIPPGEGRWPPSLSRDILHIQHMTSCLGRRSIGSLCPDLSDHTHKHMCVHTETAPTLSEHTHRDTQFVGVNWLQMAWSEPHSSV